MSPWVLCYPAWLRISHLVSYPLCVCSHLTIDCSTICILWSDLCHWVLYPAWLPSFCMSHLVLFTFVIAFLSIVPPLMWFNSCCHGLFPIWHLIAFGFTLCVCSSLNCFMVHSALHHWFLYHLWAFLCSPLVYCPWWIPSLLSPFDIHWGSISVPVGFAHVTLIRLWFSPNVVAHLLTELVLHQLSFMVQFRSHWALPIVLSLFLLNA